MLYYCMYLKQFQAVIKYLKNLNKFLPKNNFLKKKTLKSNFSNKIIIGQLDAELEKVLQYAFASPKKCNKEKEKKRPITWKSKEEKKVAHQKKKM